MEEASLIGFIQNGTISDWHTKINEWIKIEVDNKTTNWTNEDLFDFCFRFNNSKQMRFIMPKRRF